VIQVAENVELTKNAANAAFEGMLKGAGDQFPVQVDRKKPQADVDVFVARHGVNFSAETAVSSN
jgi:hypothetical protein